MPRTKFQSVVFTLIMVFCMVFCMTVYTVALSAGGLEYYVFLEAIKDMWIEYVVVFILIFFIISPLAVKLGRKYVSPEKNSPLLMTVAIQCFTVMMIVPPITLFATFLHSGFTADWFTIWISTWAKCFPAALCIQVFYVGPLVRLIFRTIFKKQLAKADEPVQVPAAEASSAYNI